MGKLCFSQIYFLSFPFVFSFTLHSIWKFNFSSFCLLYVIDVLPRFPVFFFILRILNGTFSIRNAIQRKNKNNKNRIIDFMCVLYLPELLKCRIFIRSVWDVNHSLKFSIFHFGLRPFFFFFTTLFMHIRVLKYNKFILLFFSSFYSFFVVFFFVISIIKTYVIKYINFME